MSEKKSLNLAVPVDLLDEFNRVCAHYGHGKQKGMVLSAAILMFLRANPREQGECLKELALAEIDSNVRALVDRVRAEQVARQAPPRRMSKAAKKADKNAIRVVRREEEKR